MPNYEANTIESLQRVSLPYFEILEKEPGKSRVRAVLAVLDEITSAAVSIEAASAEDVPRACPSFEILELPRDGGSRTAYRLGGAAMKAGSGGDYMEGCLWLARDGFLFTPRLEERRGSVGTYFLSGLTEPCADGVLICSPAAGGTSEFWTQKTSELYLPVEEGRLDGWVSFSESWGVSKADRFTLSAYVLAAAMMGKAAELSVSHVDWINYRLASLLSGQEAAPKEMQEAARDFIKRLVCPEDMAFMERTASCGGPVTFEEYACAAPPMDRIVFELLYKRLDAFSRTGRAARGAASVEEERRRAAGQAGADEARKDEERDGLARDIKRALLLEGALKDYCGAAQGNEEAKAALLGKIEEFFKSIEESEDFTIIRKLFGGAAEIRATSRFDEYAKARREFYLGLPGRVPESLRLWLSEKNDAGAVMDAVAAERKYYELIEYAAGLASGGLD